MFDQGRAFLAANAIGDPKAGKLLGRWKGEFGAEAVIVALGKAQREGAIEPVSYIEGVLRSGKRSDNRGGRQQRSGFRDPLLNHYAGGADPGLG
jgi:hypothetical protein